MGRKGWAEEEWQSAVSTKKSAVWWRALRETSLQEVLLLDVIAYLSTEICVLSVFFYFHLDQLFATTCFCYLIISSNDIKSQWHHYGVWRWVGAGGKNLLEQFDGLSDEMCSNFCLKKVKNNSAKDLLAEC